MISLNFKKILILLLVFVYSCNNFFDVIFAKGVAPQIVYIQKNQKDKKQKTKKNEKQKVGILKGILKIFLVAAGCLTKIYFFLEWLKILECIPLVGKFLTTEIFRFNRNKIIKDVFGFAAEKIVGNVQIPEENKFASDAIQSINLAGGEIAKQLDLEKEFMVKVTNGSLISALVEFTIFMLTAIFF
ncbi:MAG: hypothetical protein LBJ32_01755 [Oscillospiraceae bacterium]|nr:hypothetical protein [Oscillospiraceae bacterium]